MKGHIQTVELRPGLVERVWRMCPRKHLRSLPSRTRAGLFGSD